MSIIAAPLVDLLAILIFLGIFAFIQERIGKYHNAQERVRDGEGHAERSLGSGTQTDDATWLAPWPICSTRLVS